MVTHSELVRALVKPPRHILNSLTLYEVDLWHGATGIAGECGELLEAIIMPPETGFDRANIIEELGDIYFYVEQVCQRACITLDYEAAWHVATIMGIIEGKEVYTAASIAVTGSMILDTVKKAAVYNKILEHKLLSDQLSTLSVVLAQFSFNMSITREECIAANIAKLSKRYAAMSYSDAAAQARADKLVDDIDPEARSLNKPI